MLVLGSLVHSVQFCWVQFFKTLSIGYNFAKLYPISAWLLYFRNIKVPPIHNSEISYETDSDWESTPKCILNVN